MRKLIVVFTVVAAPLVAATPAAAAMADHPAAGSGDAAVVADVAARDGPAHLPAAPPASQAREAAAPRQSVETKSGAETAVLSRPYRDDAETASA